MIVSSHNTITIIFVIVHVYLYLDPEIAFTFDSYTITEGEFNISICVLLRNPSGGLGPGESFEVTFTTMPGTASNVQIVYNIYCDHIVMIIPLASDDYMSTSSSMQFNSNDTVNVTQKCITVPVIDDTISDPGETFTVIINSTNPRVIFTRNTTTVIIIDNDGRCMYFNLLAMLTN